MAGAGAGADSLLEMVAAAAARGGDRPFLWARRDGLYRPWSWRPGLPPRCGPWPAPSPRPGLAPGDRAVIVAENRPEWLVADLVMMAAGGGR